jgi:hypothetical protein
LTTLACGSGGSGGGGTGGTGGSGGSGATKPWDEGRIANTGTDWWVNATKGVFFLSIKITNSYADDAAGRATVISFVEDVIRKIAPGATPASLLPASGEFTGWTYDPNSPDTAAGPAPASNFDAATALFDGAADAIFGVAVPFTPSTRSFQPVRLVWGVYTDGATHGMDAKVVEMASQGDAGKLYTDVLTYSQYAPDNIPWKECTGSDPNPCGAL